MKICLSCGSREKDCYPNCKCAKCVNPTKYQIYKDTHPEKYKKWLKRDDTPIMEAVSEAKDILDQVRNLSKKQKPS